MLDRPTPLSFAPLSSRLTLPPTSTTPALTPRWLEQEHGIALSRSGRQMRLLTAPSADAPGSPSAALSAAASSAASGTGAAGMSQGLLDQLAGMGMGTGAGTAAGAGTPGGGATSGASPAPKRPLVQEVEPPVVAGQPDGAKPRLQYEVRRRLTSPSPPGGLVAASPMTSASPLPPTERRPVVPTCAEMEQSCCWSNSSNAWHWHWPPH